MVMGVTFEVNASYLICMHVADIVRCVCICCYLVVIVIVCVMRVWGMQ